MDAIQWTRYNIRRNQRNCSKRISPHEPLTVHAFIYTRAHGRHLHLGFARCPRDKRNLMTVQNKVTPCICNCTKL